MRIIAGRYGGRVLKTPQTKDTRPMTDRVRGALFEILGPLDKYRVLDVYAGSGALGFEALSRGAEQVEAIEAGRQAAEAIRANIINLDCSFVFTLKETKAESWIAQTTNQTRRFDLIFVMAPYALLDQELIARFGKLLNPDGLLVVEYPSQQTDFSVEGLELVTTRSYGDPTLAFYRA